jgi:hypothetical protein
MVPRVGIEPTRLASEDFESTASANSATWAYISISDITQMKARKQAFEKTLFYNTLNVFKKQTSFFMLVGVLLGFSYCVVCFIV